MKRAGFFSLLLLCLFVFALTRLVKADHTESSADGNVRFLISDGQTTQVEFAATLHADGTATGQMTFSHTSETMAQKVDGRIEGTHDTAPKLARASSDFYFKAAFDCMVVNGSRALMGGSVTESNTEKYVGRRVLLVVQDAGEGSKAASADRLTWGIYNPPPHRWLSSDAEVENDIGAGTTWLATDAERDDDVGLSSEKSDFIGCQSFPLSSFSLIKVKNGDGDIQVRP